jgi:hypothetical protein
MSKRIGQEEIKKMDLAAVLEMIARIAPVRSDKRSPLIAPFPWLIHL